MYIRFTIRSYADRTPDGSATGIFRAVWSLAVDYRFEDWAFAVLDDDLNWFQEHLPVPNNVRGGRALCWFRSAAREVISRAWQMAKLVEGAGIPVRVYRKVRPGTVVYEDAFQVAAVPWRMTFVR